MTEDRPYLNILAEVVCDMSGISVEHARARITEYVSLEEMEKPS